MLNANSRQSEAASMTRTKSGYYYPNKFARITIDAMEQVMGTNGLNAVLNLAGLEAYIGSYPEDNLDKGFDFADYTALNVALEDMYGYRGARGLALRTGRTLFADALRGFGALAGVGDMAFRVLPLNAKLRVAVPAMANIFMQFSDQISRVYEDGDRLIYTMEQCPMCWQRQSDHSVCFMGQGLLQEGLAWVAAGKEFQVDIETCMAKGDDMGRYAIYKEPLS